jgi:hypothetical protein
LSNDSVGYNYAVPVERGIFEKVAVSLRELVSSGPVALRVLRPYSPFAFDFDINFRDVAVARAVDALGLSRGEYREATEEVESILASVIQETEIQRAQGEEEAEEITAAKVAFVERQFDVPELKRRAWIKETGKAQVLFEATWEVVLKQADETKAPPQDQPVPVGNLALRGASLRNPLALLTGAETTELQLTVDRSDLKALKETLRRLDEALERAEDPADQSGENAGDDEHE